MSKLFDMVEEKEVGVAIVRFKDRLKRFGFKYLEHYLAPHDVRIEVVNCEELKDAYRELVEDLIALVSRFAGKLYGVMSYKYEGWLKASNSLLLNETCGFKTRT